MRLRFFYGPSIFPAWPAFLLAAFLFVILCVIEIRAWSLGIPSSFVSIALITLLGGFVFTTGRRLFDRSVRPSAAGRLVQLKFNR